MRTLLLALVLGSLVPAAPADARSEGRTLAYARDFVWSTAVRFLVVDEHAKVIEKDADAGYVLFEIKDDNKSYRGSLEMISVQATDNRPSIKFAINIVDRPLYREAGMLQRLEDKVRHELGTPPPPPPKKDPPKDEPGDSKGKDKPKDEPGLPSRPA